MHRVLLLLYLFLMVAGCGKRPSDYDVKVALDPTWEAIKIPGRENNVTIFSLELLEAVGAKEDLSIGVYERSWNNLLLGLEMGEYLAICTPLEPHLFHEKKYVFSDIYLETGLVLVTKKRSPFTSLEKLSGREVGFLRKVLPFLDKYPTIIQRHYHSIPDALNDLEDGLIDAALIDRLAAQAFVADLYANTLQIHLPPVTQEGLRLMGLNPKAKKFIDLFNHNLHTFQANGFYKKLSQKWGLAELAE